MINALYKKITLILSLLILNNYFLLILNSNDLIIKINFILFFLSIFFFYFKEFKKNIYLKIFFVFIIILTLGTPATDWDPRSIYLFHAKRIFYDGSLFSIIDNYASFSHNEYPNLPSAFVSSLATLIGHWNEVFPKLSFALMFFPPLLLFSTFMDEKKYIIFLSIVLFLIGHFIYTGWADGLIAIYFVTSSFLMYFLTITENEYFKKNFISNFLAICFFIILTLIKNEGAVLLILIFISTSIVNIINGRIKRNVLNILILLVSFIPIIFWKIFCYLNNLGHEFVHSETLDNFILRSSDFNNFVQIFYFLIFNEKFLISLFFLIASFIFFKNKDLLNFVLIILISYLVILTFIYLSTPNDFYFQLNSTAARIIKPLSLFAGVFGLYNLKFSNKKTLI